MDLVEARALLGLSPGDGVNQARAHYLLRTDRSTNNGDPTGNPTADSLSATHRAQLDEALLRCVVELPAVVTTERHPRLVRRAGVTTTVLASIAVLAVGLAPVIARDLIQRRPLTAAVASSVPGVAVPAEARSCSFTDNDDRQPGLDVAKYCLPATVSPQTLRKWYAGHQPASQPAADAQPCGTVRTTQNSSLTLWRPPTGGVVGYLLPTDRQSRAYISLLANPTGGCL